MRSILGFMTWLCREGNCNKKSPLQQACWRPRLHLYISQAWHFKAAPQLTHSRIQQLSPPPLPPQHLLLSPLANTCSFFPPPLPSVLSCKNSRTRSIPRQRSSWGGGACSKRSRLRNPPQDAKSVGEVHAFPRYPVT